MRDIHGFETRENCFGESEYAGDYDFDYGDDPMPEEMEFGEEIENFPIATLALDLANIAWRKRLEAQR